MVIKVKELQHEVKGFLGDSRSSYNEILEWINADYMTQTTGDHMRDTSNSVLGTSILQRWKTGDDKLKSDVIGSRSKIVGDITPPRFPNNTC